jgi:hypothetical protein
MRQSIIEKGQPLNQIIPAGVGAEALVGQQEEAPEQPEMRRGGAVGMDAMRMALMNKKVQHKQVGGISRVRRMMAGAPNKTTNIIKEGGGNWLAGGVEDAMKKLKHNDTPVLPITEAEIAAMRNAGYTVHDPVTGTYTKPNPTNQFIDKQLTKYIKNQMGTKEDPIRLAADAFPEQKAKLLAAKQVQIDKATADMEKAQQSRGFTPDMMTRSQARIRELQKEKELIERRAGMHVDPYQLNFRPEMHGKYLQEGQSAVAKSLAAKTWEGASDAQIQPTTVGELLGRSDKFVPDMGDNIVEKNQWLNKLPDDTSVYGISEPRHFVDNLGFDHMMDEMRNATNPASGLPKDLLIDPKDLSKWTMAQAAEHVDKINAYRASQKAEADVVRANNAATVLHKDYPEKGMRWVELKTPEATLPEGYKILPDVSNYKNPDNEMFAMFDDQGKAVSIGATEAEAMRLYNRQGREGTLADALKYEGETMGHCVGGYCPDVISGKSRIYSLRDAKGKPHATIEVKPSGILTNEDFGANDLRIVEGRGEFGERGYTTTDNKFFEAYSDAVNHEQKIAKPNLEMPPSIHQIKGPRNAAPSEENLPYIQDFVKSGNFSDVRDLKNTGLVKTSPEVIEHYSKQGNTAPSYMTEGEHTEASNAALDNFLQSKVNLQEPEGGMKDGGVVNMAPGGVLKKIFNVLPTAEREANKAKFLELSKVPERLYHATPSDFKKFKLGGNDPEISGHATWLSTDPTYQAAGHNIGDPRNPNLGVQIMPVHVQAKNPLMLDSPDILSRAQKMFAGGDKSFPLLMPKEWAKKVQGMGYDSIVHSDPHGRGDPHEVIMFEPEKIKSAIGNIGTYNLKDKDITKAKGGKVDMDAMRLAIMSKQLRKHHG